MANSLATLRLGNGLDDTSATFDAGVGSAVYRGAEGTNANGGNVLTIFSDIAALELVAGGAAIESPAITIAQSTIDDFARTTGDAQWIHVDPDRARRESPYGTTIAHGFLSLSLLTPLLESCVKFPFAHAFINYGFDRVRFIAPVPVESRVFGRFTLATVIRTPEGARLSWNAEVVLASGKPAVATTWLMLVVVMTAAAGTA